MGYPTSTLRSILAAGTMALLSACGSGSDLSITKVKPPVKEAAGSELTASASLLYSSKGEVGILAIGDSVQTNFFSGGGPTDIMTILGSLDGRLTEIETRAGEDVTAKFQCYEPIGSGGPLPDPKETAFPLRHHSAKTQITALTATDSE